MKSCLSVAVVALQTAIIAGPAFGAESTVTAPGDTRKEVDLVERVGAFLEQTPVERRVGATNQDESEVVGLYIAEFAGDRAQLHLYLFPDHSYVRMGEERGAFPQRINVSGSWSLQRGLLKLEASAFPEAGRHSEDLIVLPVRRLDIPSLLILVDPRTAVPFQRILGPTPSYSWDFDIYVMMKVRRTSDELSQVQARIRTDLPMEDRLGKAVQIFGLKLITGSNETNIPLVHYLDRSVVDRIVIRVPDGHNLVAKIGGIEVGSARPEISLDLSEVRFLGKARLVNGPTTLQSDSGITLSANGSVSAKDLREVPRGRGWATQ